MINVQSSVYTTLNPLGIPWWSEWWEIFTHEGVLSQSLIDDNDISPDKLRNEYILGQLGPEDREED